MCFPCCMLIGRQQACWRFKSSGTWHCTMGQVVADISKDHSAIIFSAKLHSEHKSTTVFHNARNYTAPQPQRHKSWATQMCKPQTYCYCEAKRHLAKDMKTEDVSNTKVVVFILFQHIAYRQVKMIQSHGVWVSSLMNQNFIQEEIKSILKSGNACYHSVQNLLSSNYLHSHMCLWCAQAQLLFPEKYWLYM